MTHERRRFTRINFNTEVTISTTAGKWQGQLVDISLHGALVELPDDWSGKQGDHAMLDVLLGNGEIDIRMETTVAHVHDHQIGLQTMNMDLDSITHLRRLMEINSGDPDLINRELDELGR